MELTAQQSDLLRQIERFIHSEDTVFILNGYAGTGKTTLVRHILELTGHSYAPMLMAPTGRAARILSQKTQHEATTIHKAIYQIEKVEHQDENEDIADSKLKHFFRIKYSTEKILAIVDEASMVSSHTIEHDSFSFGSDNLMLDLLTFIKPSSGGKAIFIGDPHQLPPVGESTSNALNPEYFQSKGLRVVHAELSEVLRQKADSLILKNALKIRTLLAANQRNHLSFEYNEDEVRPTRSTELIGNYLETIKHGSNNDSVIICFSNRLASNYNKEIRASLYNAEAPIQKGDILMIVKNNYPYNVMNGDFAEVLEVGEHIQQSAPVLTYVGMEKKRLLITLNFVQVLLKGPAPEPFKCMLLEDLLSNEKPQITAEQQKALYINFRIRHPELKEGSTAFFFELYGDVFYNAIQAKYGYAVTGHKCQGGEWANVFVDYTGRTGMSDDCLRWAYTATTRAQQTLYVANFPEITPFSKFRIDQIQKCKSIDAEYRVLEAYPPTPFHDENTQNYLRAKYHCIAQNISHSPYRIVSVISKPYHEIYQIETPSGTSRFDLHYKTGGIFQPAKPQSEDSYTEELSLWLNDERGMSYKFHYQPSGQAQSRLYDLMRLACDTIGAQLLNVVEHPEDYSIVYYLRTGATYSYIKIYINNSGFITYAKPMSLIGSEDKELAAIINTIHAYFI